MSLNWNASKTDYFADGELLDPNDKVVLNAIIFMTIPVGLGEITKENAGEFYARTFMVERVHGASCHNGGEPYYLTERDIHRAIGLGTNVFPNKTRLQFLRQFGREMDSQVKSFNKLTHSTEGQGK